MYQVGNPVYGRTERCPFLGVSPNSVGLALIVPHIEEPRLSTDFSMVLPTKRPAAIVHHQVHASSDPLRRKAILYASNSCHMTTSDASLVYTRGWGYTNIGNDSLRLPIGMVQWHPGPLSRGVPVPEDPEAPSYHQPHPIPYLSPAPGVFRPGAHVRSYR